MVMTAVVVMGLAMTVAARQWKTIVQRELEADLLAKGIEIQNALTLYSTTMKAGRVVPGEFYPATLADLTRPPKPFLRKLYQDPIGHGDWELIRAPTGGIMGVRSKSKGKPIKEKDFPLAVRHFEGRPTYADWVFQHPNPSTFGMVPTTAAGTPAPGQGAAMPGGPGFAPMPGGTAPPPSPMTPQPEPPAQPN
jgi:hypothetical protein